MGGRRGGKRTLTRRRVIAGGFLTAGGVLSLADAGAFSQTTATRGALVGVGDDETAVLGLDVEPVVGVGVDDAPLVTVTNNAGRDLSVAVSLADGRASESVSPGESTLAPDESASFSATLESAREGGTDALGFDVIASDGASTTFEVRRFASVPDLARLITDTSRNTNASFQIQYEVTGVPGFDRLELDVENRTNGAYGGSYVLEDDSGVVSYPEGGGDDGGAEGDEYDFTFRVYDEGGLVLEESATEVADGESEDGEDDFGDEDDPVLESFTVVDDSRYTNTAFELTYEVSRLEHFQEVVVTFDDVDVDWGGAETTTKTETDAPTGTVPYEQGGTEGDRYEITVEVRNDDGIVVDSGTVCHVAGSADDVSYPDATGECSN